jgi:serine/threonine-protein kinase RsbW
MGGSPPSAYAVTVPAEPDGLEHLHVLIDRARHDWPAVSSDDFDLLETAIIELAGNVARHGRPSGTTEVTLTVSIDADELKAVLVDAGRPLVVDLDAELPPDMDEAGRGIAMARMAVDDLAYEHDGGINTWRLIRRRR